MAWTYRGRGIRAGRSWTDVNGIRHPTNWMQWDDDRKTAIGLVWVDDPVKYDNRFYTGNGSARSLDDVTESVDGVSITTAGLKTNAIAIVKSQAAGKLASTDWHVIKASEVSGYTVPAAVTTYRAAVRTASNTIETAINNAADHAAFMALYDVPVDDNGDPTGNAPINDWPDEI